MILTQQGRHLVENSRSLNALIRYDQGSAHIESLQLRDQFPERPRTEDRFGRSVEIEYFLVGHRSPPLQLF